MNVGHQIVRDVLRVLANQTRGVSTYWVEVPERNGEEIRIRFGIIPQDLFDHGFSLPVRVGGCALIFLYALLMSIAVHAGRAGKYNFVYFVLLHHP